MPLIDEKAGTSAFIEGQSPNAPVDSPLALPLFSVPLVAPQNSSVFDSSAAAFRPDEFPIGFGKKPFSFINGFNSWLDSANAQFPSEECTCGSSGSKGIPVEIPLEPLRIGDSFGGVGVGSPFGFLKKLLSRLPSSSKISTVKMIQMNKDINVDTGDVKTKVDEKVYKVEPDGHLKKLYRVRISSDNASAPAGSKLSELVKDIPSDIQKAESQEQNAIHSSHLPKIIHHSSEQQHHGLGNEIHSNSHPFHLENHHHHHKLGHLNKPIAANHHAFSSHSIHHGAFHPSKSSLQSSKPSHFRTLALGVGIIFSFLFFLMAAVKMWRLWKRRSDKTKSSSSSSMEYVKVYNQENDSLARVVSTNSISNNEFSV